MGKKDAKKYSNFSNVERINNFLIPEEFPEGAFGSTFNSDTPVFRKSTPWQEGQRTDSAFVYPDRDRHDGLPRQTPGAHPLHDEPGNVDPSEDEPGYNPEKGQ